MDKTVDKHADKNADKTYDVFISYSPEDRLWVRHELLPRLARSNLIICIDYRDFRRGATVEQETLRAVQTSRRTLLVISPSYLESVWGDIEQAVVQSFEAGYEDIHTVPLIKERCDLPQRIKYQTCIDMTTHGAAHRPPSPQSRHRSPNGDDEPDRHALAWKQLLIALGAPPPPPPPDPVPGSTWLLAHPYPMQPTFTGRTIERSLLSEWLTTDKHHPLLVLHAAGGYGKSALAWHWLLHDIGATRFPYLIWWSFYEGTTTMESFVQAALTYLGAPSTHPPSYQQVDDLLYLLQQSGIVIILDGFERALHSYHTLDAVYQGDDPPPPPPPPTSELRIFESTLRSGTSPLTDYFLRELAAMPNVQSKVLLTSRLRPAVMEDDDGRLLPGCREITLPALMPEEAVHFLQIQGIRGSAREIRHVCEAATYHPLSLQLLAGLIVNDPHEPGDIVVAYHLDIGGPERERQHLALVYSYERLPPTCRHLLNAISCFHEPVTHSTLEALIAHQATPADIPPAEPPSHSPAERVRKWVASFLPRFGKSPPSSQSSTDLATTTAGKKTAPLLDGNGLCRRELMSRGLVLYDQSTNRYDLHPMVRHYGYHRLSTKGRIAAHRRLHSYFASAQLPAPETVHRLEDLAPAIACYHHAVLAKRYDEAFRVFYGYIAPALQESTGTIPLHIKLLRALCPDQQNDPPLLSNENEQAWVLATLGVRYSMSGQHRRAIAFKDHHNRLRERADDTHNLVIGLGNLAIDQIHMGELQGAQVSLQRLIQLCEEGGDEERAGTGHYELARLFMLIGRYPDAVHHLDRSQEIKKRTGNLQAQGIIWSLRAYLALLLLREQEIPREYVVEWQGAEWAGEHRTEHRMDVMSNIDGIDRSREHTDRMAEEREQVMGETFSGVAASIASSGEQSLPMVALEAAQRALELADEDARKSYPVEHDYMHAHWLLGAAYRLQGDIQQAEYHLQEAFRRCRTLNAVELQAEILLEMARVRAVAGLPDEAVRIAHEVLFITERHSYPLQGADVHLFFSHVAMAAGEEQTALDHARIARMLATCDGPPNHTYWVAYEEANAFLR